MLIIKSPAKTAICTLPGFWGWQTASLHSHKQSVAHPALGAAPGWHTCHWQRGENLPKMKALAVLETELWSQSPVTPRKPTFKCQKGCDSFVLLKQERQAPMLTSPQQFV